VKLTNGGHYQSENSSRRIRETRRNRMHSYARMYQQIAESITNDAPGDSPRSIELTGRTMLQIEGMLSGMSDSSNQTQMPVLS
jgi:hypothetical protein